MESMFALYMDFVISWMQQTVQLREKTSRHVLANGDRSRNKVRNLALKVEPLVGGF
jgi:hypothetical protein